ncbi:YihY/virulence factor BrkB family protein [Daejeonella sp.]|uniref:YihY/virulence factor BrkB family protein n=1 Tax=Daejeonella sp. TaxID=2805397 RepID=UPI0025C11F81|nr:YihY/virulence factor BrkB family protein [Daejeonella sp.]
MMRTSFALLKLNDPLRMGAATAFFATFALPPILIIFTQFFRFAVDPTELSSELIDRLGHILGTSSAQQVEGVLVAVTGLSHKWYITFFGFIFLIFVATTLFEVIKNSLGQIWDIRVMPKPGIGFRLKYRLRSLVIIFLAGALFLVGLVLESFQAIMGNYIDEVWGGGGWFFNRLINELVFVVALTIWLAFLFRFLTAGRPKWKISLMGAFFTAILFTIGKWILGYLLIGSNISTIYGASGSMVLIMLFVFYSAMIFYYGGCFVKVLSDTFESPIRPVRKAFAIETQVIKPE